jgi:aminomethyltransferase
MDTAGRTSPLHDRHVALGAKLAAFGGWQMPLEYAGGGVLKEHAAVREAVGVFDVSHLGKARVAGPGAAAYVNKCLSADLGKIGPGQAQYTLCCDESSGGVVDDLIAYLRAEDDVFLIPNAANTAEVCRRSALRHPRACRCRTSTPSTRSSPCRGAQRPGAGGARPPDRSRLHVVRPDRARGRGVTVCRTGYTGERGYELVTLRRGRSPPCGTRCSGPASGRDQAVLGWAPADTLRTEMGYPLHGQDLSLDITPVQARLGWAVGWGKERFLGTGGTACREGSRGRRGCCAGCARPVEASHDRA